MGTALTLLAILLVVVLIPLVVSRVARQHSDDVDGYLDDQHGGDAGRQGSWPAGGGHFGA